MAIAKAIRDFFDELFRNRYVLHLEEEIQRLEREKTDIVSRWEREKEAMRIKVERLEALLLRVSPAGVIADRQQNQKPLPQIKAGRKRWADVLNEEIAKEFAPEPEEKKSEAGAN